MRGIATRVTLVGLLVAVIPAVFAATAGADSVKPYSVVLTGGVTTGAATVNGTITNQNNQQQLGSADLTPPAGYTVQSATVSPGSASIVHNVIQLRNLNLVPGTPGGSASLTITLSSVACSTAPWSVVAKQANNFSGPPGNDLGPLINSNLVTSFCSADCPKNVTCNTNSSLTGSNANVLAPKNRNSGQLLQSGNSSSLEPLNCAGYNSSNPNTFDVFATVDRLKILTLTITKPVPGTFTTLAAQQICFNAPYQFTAAGGGQAAPDPALGGFTGLLPDCPSGSITGPCHDRTSDTTPTDPMNPLGFDIVLVADIPAGLPGDPHSR